MGMNNESANTMMQKFWDSAVNLGPNEEDEETRRLSLYHLILDIGHVLVYLVLTCTDMVISSVKIH